MTISTDMFRALLEATATKLATSVEQVDDYVKKTHVYHTIEHADLAKMVESTLEDLEQTDLIKEDSNNILGATLVAEAVVASSLTPEDRLFIHLELRKVL
jgi:hypothetical protein